MRRVVERPPPLPPGFPPVRRAQVIDSFVRCDPTTNEVTDMCSFYHLPSTVIGNDKHKTLFAAYSYYNVRVRSRPEIRRVLSGCRLQQVATSVSITELMRDALVLARDCNMDVFNALNVMVRRASHARRRSVAAHHNATPRARTGERPVPQGSQVWHRR